MSDLRNLTFIDRLQQGSQYVGISNVGNNEEMSILVRMRGVFMPISNDDPIPSNLMRIAVEVHPLWLSVRDQVLKIQYLIDVDSYKLAHFPVTIADNVLMQLKSNLLQGVLPEWRSYVATAFERLEETTPQVLS